MKKCLGNKKWRRRLGTEKLMVTWGLQEMSNVETERSGEVEKNIGVGREEK